LIKPERAITKHKEVFMDLEVLNKKISSYRDDGGRVRKVSDELLVEILEAWEQWTGPARGFYSALGVSSKGIASIIGKAKKLKREGFPSGDFKELKVVDPGNTGGFGPCSGIELCWEQGKIIRFPAVEQLIDFLKKVA
jgi:hypothetical protein